MKAPLRTRTVAAPGPLVGINLTPVHLKLCSFNCWYCQYGWSEHSRRASEPAFEHWPSAATVAKAVSAASFNRRAGQPGGSPDARRARRADDAPKFKEVVAALRKVRDELAPGVPLAVLSNASTLERAESGRRWPNSTSAT